MSAVSDSAAERESHLNEVLEIQPVVLARVARDGTILALNEAGLAMLGADHRESLLGTSLLTLLADDEQRESCRALLHRASAGRGSIQADLVNLHGTRYRAELQARGYPGAPDGIPSALVTFRDLTDLRRLEEALLNALSRQADQQQYYEAERARLIADLEQARTAESARPESSGRIAELEHELGLLRGRGETLEAERTLLVQRVDRLQKEAEARESTVQDLVDRLGSMEAEHRQISEANDQLQRELSVANASALDLAARIEALETVREDLRGRLDEAVAEQARLATALVASQEGVVRSEAERERLEQRLAEERSAFHAQRAEEIAAHEQKRREVDATYARQVHDIEAGQAARLQQMKSTHSDELQNLETVHAERRRELEAAHASRVAQIEAAHGAALEHEQREREAAVAELERLNQALCSETAARETAERVHSTLLETLGELVRNGTQAAATVGVRVEEGAS